MEVASDGCSEGRSEGLTEGSREGVAVGTIDGEGVGTGDGSSVGGNVTKLRSFWTFTLISVPVVETISAYMISESPKRSFSCTLNMLTKICSACVRLKE